MPYQAWLASCMGTEWYGTRASYDKYRNPFRHLRKRKETIISRKLYTIEMIIIISWWCRVFLFCFLLFNSITPIPERPYNILRYAFVHPSLYLRYRFALPSLVIRFWTVPMNGRKMGLTRDLQGNYLGFAAKLKLTWKKEFLHNSATRHP